MDISKIAEFEIPVPWGHMAVKAWGDEKDPLILVVHGLTDNAGSFDRLIPLLPHSFYYACIDLPGHGKSSHFPQNLPVFSVNYVLAYLYAMEYFGKDNYIVIAHSYGAQIAKLVAQLYPSRISKLIMLDTLHLQLVTPEDFATYLRKRLEFFMRLHKKLDDKNPPLYTYDEALKRITRARSGELKEESAVALLKRHLQPVGDKFKFTQDPRLKLFINPMHDEGYALKVLEMNPLKCPVLIIFTVLSKVQRAQAKKLYKSMNAQKNVKIVLIYGSHDVHNDEPQVVAPLVSKFLLETSNKL